MSRPSLIVWYAVMLSRPRNAVAMRRQAVSRFVASPLAVWKYGPGMLAALAAASTHAREGQGGTLTVPVAAVENGVNFARWDRASKGSVMAAATNASAVALRASHKHQFALWPGRGQPRRPRNTKVPTR